MYAETKIMPRFYETDQAGHINNTVVTQWLEFGRTDFLFRHLCIQPLMMLRHISVSYDNELNFPAEAIVRTSVERLGNSSVHTYQEIWQGGKRRVTAHAVDCYFDPKNRASMPIPASDRDLYEKFLVVVDAS